MATVHIIGAGISGLAAATALAERHVPVKLYEASHAAGGRTRSSNDVSLGTVDHGLHVFSGAAKELLRFITRIQAKDRLLPLTPPYNMCDYLRGSTQHFRPSRAFAAMPVADIAMLAGHLLQPGELRVCDMVSPDSPLQDGLELLSRLGLAQPAHKASARQLQQLAKRLLKRGGSKLFMPRESLQDSFIAPALAHLEYHGGSVYFGMGLKSVDFSDAGPVNLGFARKKLPMQEGDVLILATPPAVSKTFLGTIDVPTQTHTAITFHFAVAHQETPGSVLFFAHAPMDMLRYQEGRISAAIRLADHAWHGDETFLAARVWQAICRQHSYLHGQPMPEWASWREKRAGHVPSDRPLPSPVLPARTLLAGDWLDVTRAPCLESAAASGHAAASAAVAMLDRKTVPSQYNFYLN